MPRREEVRFWAHFEGRVDRICSQVVVEQAKGDSRIVQASGLRGPKDGICI